MHKLRIFSVTGIVILLWGTVFGQYPPPAGYPGTTAMLKDSSAFAGWAISCSVIRGFLNISDTTFKIDGSNKASVGVDANGIGIADGQVVSLGDGGSATMTFVNAIANGPGFDFAIFENGFSNGFLELAFVEVSSDGQHFVRFPAVSLTLVTKQVGTFDTLDATKLNNIAGKYREFYGTPFDLEDLKDSAGIDLTHVTHVRTRDVVGSILSPYATYDSQGNIVNDPWPTPFSSCGFDLDAIGVIHFAPQGFEENNKIDLVSCYPNPVYGKIFISVSGNQPCTISISDISGRKLMEQHGSSGTISLDLGSFTNGFYFIFLRFSDGTIVTKKILKQ